MLFRAEFHNILDTSKTCKFNVGGMLNFGMLKPAVYTVTVRLLTVNMVWIMIKVSNFTILES
jgi:hypothetical protein